MCIFSGKVEHVNSTNIFCSNLGVEHATVYQMKAMIESEMAMILPVPVRDGATESDLRFINLEEYPKFFDHMKELFPEPVSRGRMKSLGAFCAAPLLKVQEVGQYEASFAPKLVDLLRLDPRFKLPLHIFKLLPNYNSFGFAVFKLKPDAVLKDFHPMAYAYKPERADMLFFPTVHVHDGEVAEVADYDHCLYYQHDAKFKSMGYEEVSSIEPKQKMTIDRCAGLVRETDKLSRLKMRGQFPNGDHVLLGQNSSSVMEVQKTRKAA
jgi:hypothetical protein